MGSKNGGACTMERGSMRRKALASDVDSVNLCAARSSTVQKAETVGLCRRKMHREIAQKLKSGLTPGPGGGTSMSSIEFHSCAHAAVPQQGGPHEVPLRQLVRATGNA